MYSLRERSLTVFVLRWHPANGDAVRCSRYHDWGRGRCGRGRHLRPEQSLSRGWTVASKGACRHTYLCMPLHGSVARATGGGSKRSEHERRQAHRSESSTSAHDGGLLLTQTCHFHQRDPPMLAAREKISTPLLSPTPHRVIHRWKQPRDPQRAPFNLSNHPRLTRRRCVGANKGLSRTPAT